MRKFMMITALVVCTAFLVSGAVELGLIGDVQAQVSDTEKKKKPPKTKKKARCPAPDPACDPALGPAVRCRGCIYESVDCAASAGWSVDQCREIHVARRKTPPKK